MSSPSIDAARAQARIPATTGTHPARHQVQLIRYRVQSKRSRQPTVAASPCARGPVHRTHGMRNEMLFFMDERIKRAWKWMRSGLPGGLGGRGGERTR
jgi:hypothetical protein